MNIQSLSVVVPLEGCVNNCKYCVSRTHENKYEDLISDKDSDRRIIRQYLNRLQFARDCGCNCVVFTGIGEPLQNKKFISNFMSSYNVDINPRFVWFELQTSGVLLTDNNLRFLKSLNFSTISLSLSNMFDSVDNGLISDIPSSLLFDIDSLCSNIKSHGFNLRLSLNLTNSYNNRTPDEIFSRAQELGADQITFRELYYSNVDCEQNRWIAGNRASLETIARIESYVSLYGKGLEILPFGARKYSVNNIGVVIDDDCMSKETKDSIRYLILRENCKLYTKWDDPASLIF